MKKIKSLDLINKDQLNAISEKKDWINVLSLACNWMGIFLGISLFVLFPSFVTCILSIVIVGSRQFALAVLGHDAAHRLLFSNSKINDWAGQWLCSFPLFLDNRIYRPYHIEHHKFTERKEDPDKVLSDPFPITKRSFFRKVVRDITGLTGLKRYSATMFSIAKSKSDNESSRAYKVFYKSNGFVVTNLIIFLSISSLFHWSLFFLLWWLPACTYYSLIIRIRNIAEHGVTPGNSDFDNTRTTKANYLIRFLMVPHFVNYHLEHHLFLNCPWYNLPKAHKMLIENGYEDEMCLEDSYKSVLKRATSG